MKYSVHAILATTSDQIPADGFTAIPCSTLTAMQKSIQEDENPVEAPDWKTAAEKLEEHLDDFWVGSNHEIEVSKSKHVKPGVWEKDNEDRWYGHLKIKFNKKYALIYCQPDETEPFKHLLNVFINRDGS